MMIVLGDWHSATSDLLQQLGFVTCLFVTKLVNWSLHPSARQLLLLQAMSWALAKRRTEHAQQWMFRAVIAWCDCSRARTPHHTCLSDPLPRTLQRPRHDHVPATLVFTWPLNEWYRTWSAATALFIPAPGIDSVNNWWPRRVRSVCTAKCY